MPPKKKPSAPKLSTLVDSLKHADKPDNIPTRELYIIYRLAGRENK
jgi:hypothetical protein